MSEISTVALPDLVSNAEILWHKGSETIDPVMRKSGIVKEVSISQGTGNTREFSSIDTNEFLTYKAEDDQSARGKVQQGYKNTMTSFRVSENIGISYETRTQGKYEKWVNDILSGGAKGAKTIELDLSHRIGFGTATTYADRDGRTIAIDTGDDLALFSTVKKLKGSTTTYRNILTNNPRFSKGAMEGMERLIVEETYNELGEKNTAKFDTIFSTDDPNTVNTIQEYLKSTGDPTATHAGVSNVYKGKYKHLIMPYLATDAYGAPDTDKRYYWGIASSSLSTFMLGVWEEPHLIAPQASANSEDVETDSYVWRNRAGYGITIVDGKFIKISKGNGDA
jgi:hypothetical protein